MAKKRKTTKRRKVTKEVKPEHELPGGFWHQVIAVLMIALALFFVITWFGHGGTVLNEVHKFPLSFKHGYINDDNICELTGL